MKKLNLTEEEMEKVAGGVTYEECMSNCGGLSICEGLCVYLKLCPYKHLEAPDCNLCKSSECPYCHVECPHPYEAYRHCSYFGKDF